MIHYASGNLLESEAETLVNTVNTEGVMGKGIALQFKTQFPDNYHAYRKKCRENQLKIGQLFITKDTSLLSGQKTIINFPTKTQWRLPSRYEYISEGLKALRHYLLENKVKSIAIPPLGSGNGGLDWNRVKSMIEHALSDVPTTVFIFEPIRNGDIVEKIKPEKVNLTPARAMLLQVMNEIVVNDHDISEFAAEKIIYFLQRFGAEPTYRIRFQPNFYGPYSGKAKHILYDLNGSYILGYSTKSQKPFEELQLIEERQAEVTQFLQAPKHAKYRAISGNVSSFLEGFYSPFSLELLSTVDYIMNQYSLDTEDEVAGEIKNWSEHKRTMFDNRHYISVAMANIRQHRQQMSAHIND